MKHAIEKTMIRFRDQRIAQDVDKMCLSYSQLVATLLLSPFTISYYTYQTWKTYVKLNFSHASNFISFYSYRVGPVGPICVFLFFLVSSVINKLLMSPVASLVYDQQKLEGDFRFIIIFLNLIES